VNFEQMTDNAEPSIVKSGASYVAQRCRQQKGFLLFPSGEW